MGPRLLDRVCEIASLASEHAHALLSDAVVRAESFIKGRESTWHIEKKQDATTNASTGKSLKKC